MSQVETRMQVAGVWLAIAAALLAATLILHGPIDPDLGQQMKFIAENALRWEIAHWAAAAGLSLFAVSGLIVLTAGSRLTEGASAISAWAVLIVGALWTMTTAVAEATVVTNAAIAGNGARFEAWWAFAEGKATGFMFLALAVAVIAANEVHSARAATPAWASWIAVAAGVGAFLGWALGMWIGIGVGNLVWLAASLVLSVWTLWFGLGLAGRGLGVRIGARSSA